MKGLRKVLTPFAPDQSGASGVLYSMGAMIVIIDAGGCTGNVCGFDEPRWHETRSAVFSAGLRDMDAILGRDEYDWSRKWKPTPVLLLGKFHGQRNLLGNSPWGSKELNKTE